MITACTTIQSRMRISESKPSPSVCPACGAERPYVNRSGVCWIRECCECDAEADRLREERYQDDCERRGEYLIGVAMGRCNIPQRYKAVRFESAVVDHHNAKAVKAAKEWAANPFGHKGFYFYGIPGTGKTHVACCAVYAAIEGGRLIFGKSDLHPSQWKTGLAIYANLPHWIQASRKSIDDPSLNAELNAVQNASILLLDEIGAEATTAFVRERVYDLVNHRYEHELPTLFTSNCKLSEVGERMSDKRIASRIAEMCAQIPLTGEDRRLAGMKVYRGGE